MNATQRLPREVRKENGPLTEKLHVPPQKRARFVGVGGYNLRRLVAETGVSVSAIDETNFQVFAPNQSAMDEAYEKIDELLNEEVSNGCFYSAQITAPFPHSSMSSFNFTHCLL